jgi:hypothetical protein
MSESRPTSGEREQPGGVGGGSPDKGGSSGDKGGTGQGGDKPSGGTPPTNPSGR